jgi:hypothetical protein
MFSRRHVFALAAFLVLLATAGPAVAQFNPYAPGYYPPPAPYVSGWGPGGVLAGQAQVMQAAGQLGIDQEKARIERQKYYQEKLVTKKAAFDLAAYEKANTPTYTEKREQDISMILRRMMSDPAPPEITRGDTLNAMMPLVRSMSTIGVSGSPVSLSPSMLKTINVGTGTSGGDTTSAGMLKDGGKLAWPLMLRGANQKKMDMLLPKAVEQAIDGTLEPKTYSQLVGLIQTMTEENRKNYHKDAISSKAFLDGKHFLESLEKSLRVLQEPDPSMYLGAKTTVQGSTVPELVANMTAKGLKFAPATPGQEASYFALHNAFVTYANAGQAASGFQSALSRKENPDRPPK